MSFFIVYAVTSNHVSICSGLAAVFNAKLLPAAITQSAPNFRILS